MFMFLDSKRVQKNFWNEMHWTFSEFNMLFI